MNISLWFRIPADFPGLVVLGSYLEPSVIVTDGLFSGMLRRMGFFHSHDLFPCVEGVFKVLPQDLCGC